MGNDYKYFNYAMYIGIIKFSKRRANEPTKIRTRPL